MFYARCVVMIKFMGIVPMWLWFNKLVVAHDQVKLLYIKHTNINNNNYNNIIIIFSVETKVSLVFCC